MNYLKAFIAGITVPSIILPIGIYSALAWGKPQLLTIPFLHFIPLIWGLWNVLSVAFFKNALPQDPNLRLLLTGAVLGVLVIGYATFWLDLPTLMGIPGQFKYLPIIIGPIVYALIWRWLVEPLNQLLAVKE